MEDRYQAKIARADLIHVLTIVVGAVMPQRLVGTLLKDNFIIGVISSGGM